MIFGKSVLSVEAGNDPYARKYKGIWICFLILARALGGNYVMCGVFELYGDPSLKVPCPPGHLSVLRQWCHSCQLSVPSAELTGLPTCKVKLMR